MAVRRVRADASAPMRQADPARWLGEGRNYLFAQALGVAELEFNGLALEPGTRTRPHAHSADQVIYQVSGVGIVAVGGGDDERVETGECVLLPGGIPHMHGAAEDGPAFVVTALRSGFTTDFDCPIPAVWQRFRADE
jgi:quercetin dioxygenase-like cupin family protein